MNVVTVEASEFYTYSLKLEHYESLIKSQPVSSS